MIGGVPCPLKPLVWDAELHDDKDKNYIINGIKNGFPLVPDNNIMK
jgi:hypothetical protein